MRAHQVEVDDEVFAFVKSHAEPLVDTFNSSLRRLLPFNTVKPVKAAITLAESSSSFPSGTPQALRQILEVAALVRGGAYARTSATRFVAKQHRVATQTVQDKYARQMGLTTNQFDHLLEQSDRKELKCLLRSKFPEHSVIIDSSLS
ncbi:MAG: hypothetical protein ACYDCY_14740 [Metallibacterium sp.]